MLLDDFIEWVKPILKIARDLVIIVFLAAIAWKIVTVKIDLTSFDFSDLLALIMAIFAVSLSAAFYFQANKSSHDFYDNIYNFTKDTSEMLGRIESGFGERLKNIDTSFTGFKESLSDLRNQEKTIESLDKKKEESENAEKTREELIKKLTTRTDMQKEEMNGILHQLAELSKELKEKKSEISRLQKKLDKSPIINSRATGTRVDELRGYRGIARFLSRLMIKYFDTHDIQEVPPLPDLLPSLFKGGRIPPNLRRDMARIGVLSLDGDLTVKGTAMLDSIIDSIYLEKNI